MYSEWHKYDEAVPELEKASSLIPDSDPGSAELQVSLGDAYRSEERRVGKECLE